MINGLHQRSAPQLVLSSLHARHVRRTCTVRCMQAQGQSSDSRPATGIPKRAAGRPLVQPVESLTSLDLDDLDTTPIQPNSVLDASNQARAQDRNDARLAQTLLAPKLAILGLGVRPYIRMWYNVVAQSSTNRRCCSQNVSRVAVLCNT